VAYTKQTWADGEAGETPIEAAALNHIEDGIEAAAATADTASAGLADKADADHTHTELTTATDTSTAGTIVRRDASGGFGAAYVFGLLTPSGATSATPKSYVDSGDATAKVRTNHTGTQAISTVDGLQTALDAKLESVAFDDLPAGTTLTVLKSGGTWPARPTSRSDIIVAWKGADPSPAIVTSGTGGMLDEVDYRLVTP
jgi:hypothetical protein